MPLVDISGDLVASPRRYEELRLTHWMLTEAGPRWLRQHLRRHSRPLLPDLPGDVRLPPECLGEASQWLEQSPLVTGRCDLHGIFECEALPLRVDRRLIAVRVRCEVPRDAEAFRAWFAPKPCGYRM